MVILIIWLMSRSFWTLLEVSLSIFSRSSICLAYSFSMSWSTRTRTCLFSRYPGYGIRGKVLPYQCHAFSRALPPLNQKFFLPPPWERPFSRLNDWLEWGLQAMKGSLLIRFLFSDWSPAFLRHRSSNSFLIFCCGVTNASSIFAKPVLSIFDI